MYVPLGTRSLHSSRGPGAPAAAAAAAPLESPRPPVAHIQLALASHLDLGVLGLRRSLEWRCARRSHEWRCARRCRGHIRGWRCCGSRSSGCSWWDGPLPLRVAARAESCQGTANSSRQIICDTANPTPLAIRHRSAAARLRGDTQGIMFGVPALALSHVALAWQLRLAHSLNSKVCGCWGGTRACGPSVETILWGGQSLARRNSYYRLGGFPRRQPSKGRLLPGLRRP